MQYKGSPGPDPFPLPPNRSSESTTEIAAESVNEVFRPARLQEAGGGFGAQVSLWPAGEFQGDDRAGRPSREEVRPAANTDGDPDVRFMTIGREDGVVLLGLV